MLTPSGANVNNICDRKSTEATLNNRVIKTNLFITKVGFIDYGSIIKAIIFISFRHLPEVL